MTAPMPTLGLETPEQKAARLAAEAAQAKLQAPALSLADRAASTAAGAGTAVTAPTDMMTKTISGAPPVDRFTLAQQKWDTSTAASAPAYEASLRSAKQQAAGQGQLGSGMLRTTLGDLSLQRQRDMDTTRQSLMQDAITGSINDNQFDVGTQTQQQGYQSAEDARRFAQGLQSQQLGLDTTLGLGDLGVKQQQATTNRMDTTGNLEINRAELTAKYGAAEADRMIEAQKVTNQNTQAQGQLSLATSAETARQGESAADLALRREALTKQYGAVEADRMLEREKLAQQGSQFGQTMTLEQKKADLDRQVQLGQLSNATAAQQLAQWQAQQGLTLDQQKLAQQGTQFTQQMALDTKKQELDAKIQTGQLTLAQANQELAKWQAEQSLTLDYTKLGQQDAQFGQSDATTQRGQTLEADARRQTLLMEIAKIFGVSDVTKIPPAVLTALGLGSSTPGTVVAGTYPGQTPPGTYTPATYPPTATPRPTTSTTPPMPTPTPAPTPAAPLPLGVTPPPEGTTTTVYNGANTVPGWAEWIDPTTGEMKRTPANQVPAGVAMTPINQPIDTLSGQWVPPSAAPGSAPLVPLAGGGTATTTATPTNQFLGYVSGQGGTFGASPSQVAGATWQDVGEMMHATPQQVQEMQAQAAEAGVTDPQRAYALRSLSSMTGLTPAQMWPDASQMTEQQLYNASKLIGGIGNRVPGAVEAALTSTDPFIKRLALAAQGG